MSFLFMIRYLENLTVPLPEISYGGATFFVSGSVTACRALVYVEACPPPAPTLVPGTGACADAGQAWANDAKHFLSQRQPLKCGLDTAAQGLSRPKGYDWHLAEG